MAGYHQAHSSKELEEDRKEAGHWLKKLRSAVLTAEGARKTRLGVPGGQSLNFGYVESIVECDALILLPANS
jgi:hypothetical protein